jgi:hypothetical protein
MEADFSALGTRLAWDSLSSLAPKPSPSAPALQAGGWFRGGRVDLPADGATQSLLAGQLPEEKDDALLVLDVARRLTFCICRRKQATSKVEA